MSSGSERDPLCGIITQSGKVVGSICIPEEGGEFIGEFNICYGPLRMQIAELDPLSRATGTLPKFRFRLPTWYSEAWRPRKEIALPAKPGLELEN